jgi:pyrroloquinoline quinone (PQQ) biosynthesis protein C
VLDDIAACGFDKELTRKASPSLATEVMVAYAYDMVNRVNPTGFFGMVLVLEGTSTVAASQAASSLAKSLNLPANCFVYLTSHGALDVGHTEFYENLVNKITDKNDQQLLIQSAKNFYKLYGDIFKEIELRTMN